MIMTMCSSAFPAECKGSQHNMESRMLAPAHLNIPVRVVPEGTLAIDFQRLHEVHTTYDVRAWISELRRGHVSHAGCL